MRLRILQVEAIQALLLELSALATKIEARESDALDGVIDWIRRAEAQCHAMQLPAAAELAAVRGLLVLAGRGALMPGVHLTGRPTRRKARESAASQGIVRGQEILGGAIRGRREQLEECARIAGQIAAVADAKGYPSACAGARTNTEYLQAIEDRIRSDADLLSVWIHLVGLAGPVDALVLLDRALPQKNLS